MSPYVSMGSSLEMADTVDKMNALLEMAQIENQEVRFPNSEESFPYKKVLDQVLYVFQKTLKGQREISGEEGQKIRLIGSSISRISVHLRRSKWEQLADCIGELFCCCSCPYGFAVCKERAIFAFVDNLE